MRTVAIAALRSKLNEYVLAAEAGETLLVTDRDRVVAELSPPRQRSGDACKEAFLERGAREGWLTRAKRDRTEPLPDRGPPPPDAPGIPFEVLMADLADAREDR